MLGFSRAFDTAVWKMVTVPGSPVLILELRDDVNREVTFTAFNYITNEFLWEHVKLSEPWWVSLFDADATTVYCRKFQNTDNPDDVVWVGIDLKSGGEVAAIETIRKARGPADISNPSQYVQGHEYFEKVREFLKSRMAVEAVRALEYLEHAGMIIISFYVSSGKVFENHLVVFDEGGTQRLKAVLGKELTGVGLEIFFVRHNRLFFVKNKTELLIYSLA